MNISVENILSFLIAGGLGGILASYFNYIFQQRKETNEQQRRLKLKRYGAISIQMLTILDPESALSKVREIRPDLKDVNDYREEIKTEILNSILFAGDEVILTLIEFFKKPNDANYVKTIKAMRKDLWGNSSNVEEELLVSLYNFH